jgi:hypothetical protein
VNTNSVDLAVPSEVGTSVFAALFFSPAALALWRALANESEWVVGEYRATHTPTQTEWWIANGASFFNGQAPTPACLGILERHVLWRRFATLRNRMVARHMNTQAPTLDATAK